MSEVNSSSPALCESLPRHLGAGLVLRQATDLDILALADFYDNIFRDENDPPNGFRVWICDLTSGEHPTCRVGNFIVVEDRSRDGRIVSAGVLIAQRFSYAGIPIAAGQPELIATDPDYRRRGLIRAVMRELHRMSDADGHLFQLIGGIPWFYRQFGYEYALSMKTTRSVHVDDIPALAANRAEPFELRRAVSDDAESLQQLCVENSRRWLVTTVCDAARWRYEITQRSVESLESFNTWCIVRGREHARAGEVVGYALAHNRLQGGVLGVWELSATQAISWSELMPALLRAFHRDGDILAQAGGGESLTKIELALAEDHPAWEVLSPILSKQRLPYAWYVRVPDLAGFLRQVAPVLDQRLIQSPVAGYSGSLDISFYRDGLHIEWEHGRLTRAEALPFELLQDKRPAAMFPPLVFLQLVFGNRTVEQLQESLPDCRVNNEARLIFNSLFPLQTSHIRTLH